MISTAFFIPVTDNLGTPFTAADWRWLEGRALALFGGMTRSGGQYGLWRDGNQVYRDESIRIGIALQHWIDLPPWLRFVEQARRRFRQIALYIEVAGIPDILGQSGERGQP